MKNEHKRPVSFLKVDKEHHLQRIDNYLIAQLKGLPKSRLYKALRKGEIRVNKKRVGPHYKIQEGEWIRLPPLSLSSKPISVPGQSICDWVKSRIIFEDEDLIVLNKPSGIAVHGGSGLSFGVIEVLRAICPAPGLELIHRLDKETSGCLMIAKKRGILKEIQLLLRERKVKKTYLLLVAGQCNFEYKTVAVPIQKNIKKSGERVAVIDPAGKSAKTIFKRIRTFDSFSLLEARPVTGRTHQIRVHAVYLGHPILGDQKYGTEIANQLAKSMGLKQMCLHALSIQFHLKSKEQEIGLCAVLKEPWRPMTIESGALNSPC